MRQIELEIDKIDSLTKIIGIGDKKAKEFVKKGIKSAEDLKKKVKNEKITVNNKIELGLKYYEL